MTKCTFCNQETPDFYGTYVVDAVSSKVRYFCSSKCRKNFNMDRKKKKWAKFQIGNKPAAKTVFKQR